MLAHRSFVLPILSLQKPRNRKTKVQIDSSDEEAVPLKPKSSSVDDDGGDNKEDSDTDEEDGKPLQAKVAAFEYLYIF